MTEEGIWKNWMSIWIWWCTLQAVGSHRSMDPGDWLKLWINHEKKHTSIRQFRTSMRRERWGAGWDRGRKGRAQHCCHFQEYERNIKKQKNGRWTTVNLWASQWLESNWHDTKLLEASDVRFCLSTMSINAFIFWQEFLKSRAPPESCTADRDACESAGGCSGCEFHARSTDRLVLFGPIWSTIWINLV